MTDTACKTLAAHLDERRAQGLVDIKFYIHQADVAGPTLAAHEARMLFDAVPHAERFQFGDSRRSAKAT